ncbi:hypothetical protein Ddc_03786 [Ditylenchus destructor]|nr:hypothetical protein Ddc_03786 [Ditylenchus destructor]
MLKSKLVASTGILREGTGERLLECRPSCGVDDANSRHSFPTSKHCLLGPRESDASAARRAHTIGWHYAGHLSAVAFQAGANGSLISAGKKRTPLCGSWHKTNAEMTSGVMRHSEQ